MLYNCIPIGHFDDEIAKDQFCINIDGNNVDDFLYGFHSSYDLGDSEYSDKLSIIENLPHPTFENTVREYLDAINQLTIK